MTVLKSMMVCEDFIKVTVNAADKEFVEEWIHSNIPNTKVFDFSDNNYNRIRHLEIYFMGEDLEADKAMFIFKFSNNNRVAANIDEEPVKIYPEKIDQLDYIKWLSGIE